MIYKFNKGEMLRFGIARPTVDAMERVVTAVVDVIGDTGTLATAEDLISLPDDGVSASTMAQQLQNQVDSIQATLLEHVSATSKLAELSQRIDDLSMQIAMLTYPTIPTKDEPLPVESSSRISNLESKLDNLANYIYATSS